jgi:predicted dehydrogenase
MALRSDRTTYPANTSMSHDRHPEGIRLGIVGCGAIVREVHMQVALGEPGVTVAVLCDRDRRAAERMREEFDLHAEVVDDVTALAGRIDAAIVAVPPALHAPISMQLLSAGIDVLCEKPLANTFADGVRMAQCAREHDRVLAVALMSRFFPHNLWLRDLIEDGEIGEPLELIAEDGAPLDWAMSTGSYFDRRFTGGGVLFDAGVHVLDRLLWLFGDLDGIAYEDDSFGGFETNARLTGTFAIAGHRVPARMEFSWSHRLPRSIQVVGSRGSIEARIQDPRSLAIRRRGRRGQMDLHLRCAERWHHFSAYRLQLRDFLDAVRRRSEPFVTAESSLRALQVIETAYAQRRSMAQAWLTREGAT